MRSKKAGAALVAMLAGLAALARSDDRSQLAQDIGDHVYCMCGGCVGLLNHCPHPDAECSTKLEMKTMIAREVAEGKSETAILQDLVHRYGVQVLASPPAKGFNLTVWILPGVGLLAGLALVVFLVRRWRHPAPEAAAPAPPVTIDPKVLAAMEEEMKKMERS
jgi:cytochrome c-type biogenesis protein CcmH